jgi:anti-sigma-K factor RskA
MHCAGFSSDTYDRYVLGLLEEPDRSQLEGQIQEQCPVCLTGVQRSMNLWLVFAETLENAEPSEDFRGRVVRIAELSRKVLTFPKNSAVRERSAVPISTLLVICAVTSVLLVATWFAARSSLRLDAQPVSADLDRLAQDFANNKVKLDQETVKRKQLENELGSSGRAALASMKTLEDNLSRCKADAEQCRGAMERDKQQITDSDVLLNIFGRTGTRLLPMKASETAGKAFAYAIFSPGSRLVFVGSNLPKHEGHALQLWIVRKESPTEVSAGVFTVQEKGPSVVHYEDASLLSGVTSIFVTEEPIPAADAPPASAKLSDAKPSDPKLFEASTEEEN